MLHGDLGRSFTDNEPVTTTISSRLPATIELALFAMVVGTTLGLGLGVLSALKRDTPDRHCKPNDRARRRLATGVLGRGDGGSRLLRPPRLASGRRKLRQSGRLPPSYRVPHSRRPDRRQPAGLVDRVRAPAASRARARHLRRRLHRPDHAHHDARRTDTGVRAHSGREGHLSPTDRPSPRATEYGLARRHRDRTPVRAPPRAAPR